ncbi:MAG: hypothetical protein WAK28_14045, partial [Trebonia sp.]
MAARSLEMPRLARPVNSGTPLSLVSKATARVFCPPRLPRLPAPSSQPRTPGPSASGSMVSPLSCLRAASAAQRR